MSQPKVSASRYDGRPQQAKRLESAKAQHEHKLAQSKEPKVRDRWIKSTDRFQKTRKVDMVRKFGESYGEKNINHGLADVGLDTQSAQLIFDSELDD